MLTDAELTQLRADIVVTLPGTCVVQRASTAANDYGYPDSTWSAVGTAICRVDPLNKNDNKEIVGAQEAARVYRILTVQWDTDIRSGDRVTFGSETYDIIELFDDHSLRAVRRANLARID